MYTSSTVYTVNVNVYFINEAYIAVYEFITDGEGRRLEKGRSEGGVYFIYLFIYLFKSIIIRIL